jgi:hypothetical protein
MGTAAYSLFGWRHCGRRPRRQRKAEPCAAVRVVLRPDPAAVRVDNRAADRKPQAYTWGCRLARAARELLEE